MIEILAPSLSPALVGVLCYAGAVLYAGVLTVPGRSRFAASWQLLLFYLAAFPLPGPSPAWLGQQVLLIVAGGTLGPQIVLKQLELRDELLQRDGRAAGRARPLAFPLLLCVPAATASAVVLVALWRVWGEPQRLDVGGDAATGLLRAWAILVAVLALYLGAAFLLGRRWARTAVRIPLLAPAVRFHAFNGLGALALAIVAVAQAVAAAGSPAVALLALATLVFALAPGLNEASASYDAVLSRVVTFHVVALAIAAVVVAARRLEALGLSGPLQDVLVPAGAAVLAMALPAQVSRLVELRLFPRAARLRTRLAELAALPIASGTRADAARDLLARIVESLDAEGAVLAIGTSGAEPAVLVPLGRVDAAPLGAPAQAVAWLSSLAPRSRPVAAERLRMPDQLRLLRCGAVVVVPFRTAAASGALLLGPRRGRLYDAATLDAVVAFAGQTAVALENTLLLAARAHAEKLAALGEAAARIAHEIRNPLASARSLVQLVGRDPRPRELAETALGELDRIARLVGDLVAFARRQEVVRSERVDLAEVCRLAAAQLDAMAREASVTVALEVDSCVLRADGERLVQVVANLLRNAIEALAEPAAPVDPRTAADACRRRVALRTMPQGSGDGAPSIRLEVADTGPGIAADELESVFEPFRTTKRSGSGLGLAIARRIVEAHGGRITAESRVGRGTTFTIELPLDSPLPTTRAGVVAPTP